MVSFREVNEVANNPADVSWTKKGIELFGNFKVQEQEFNIEVTILEENIFQFKFYRDSQTKLFNDNKFALVVIPTIKNALDYAMDTLNPDVLLFATSDDSKSRKSLYRLNSARIARKYNYYDVSMNSELAKLGYTEFVFGVYRNKEVLNKIIKDL